MDKDRASSLPRQHPGAASMVEMHVGGENPPKITNGESRPLDAFLEGFDSAGGTRVEENKPTVRRRQE